MEEKRKIIVANGTLPQGARSRPILTRTRNGSVPEKSVTTHRDFATILARFVMMSLRFVTDSPDLITAWLRSVTTSLKIGFFVRRFVTVHARFVTFSGRVVAAPA